MSKRRLSFGYNLTRFCIYFLFVCKGGRGWSTASSWTKKKRRCVKNKFWIEISIVLDHLALFLLKFIFHSIFSTVHNHTWLLLRIIYSHTKRQSTTTKQHTNTQTKENEKSQTPIYLFFFFSRVYISKKRLPAHTNGQ